MSLGRRWQNKRHSIGIMTKLYWSFPSVDASGTISYTSHLSTMILSPQRENQTNKVSIGGLSL